MFDSRLNVGCFIMVFVQVKYGFRTEVLFVSTPNSFDVSWYKCLIVSSFFPPRFLEWESFSDCAFS